MHLCIVLCLIVQSRPTLFHPTDCSLLGSSVHGNSPGRNTGVGCHALLQARDLPNQVTPALQADSLPCEPPRKPKNTGVGSLSLPQGIFPTQELNRGLLHCSQILYQPSYQGSPTNKLTSLKKKKKLSFYPWTLSSHCSNHTYKPLTIHTHTHQIHSPSTHLLHPLNTYFYSVSAILLRLLSKSRKSSL